MNLYNVIFTACFYIGLATVLIIHSTQLTILEKELTAFEIGYLVPSIDALKECNRVYAELEVCNQTEEEFINE